MRIGILGTGTLAAALGETWTRAGHDVVVAGRSPAKARDLADRLGSGAQAVTPRQATVGRDAVLLAVSWTGVEDMLRAAGAPEGSLDATPLIDPTNAVDHGIGILRTGHGDSMAQGIARLAQGAHVVKAFHLFPAEQWIGLAAAEEPSVTVPICGDDSGAVHIVSQLIRDAGAVPAVLGTLDRARQLEEVAGFVIGMAFAGIDPNAAIPRVRTSPA